VKLDDCFSDHPKVEQAGDLAAWMYVCGLQYCSRALSDGFVPATRVPRLTGLSRPMKLAEKLVEVGLWEPVDGGFQVHDYAEHQRTAEQIKHQRQTTANRVTRHREQRSRNGVTGAVTRTVTNGAVTPPDTDTDKKTPHTPQKGTGTSAPAKPIELPAGLSGFLVPVADALRHVAAEKPGAITPTDNAVAKSLQDFPNKDFVPLVQDFEHYWLHGAGQGTVRKDIVSTWRKRLATQPDVLHKTPPRRPGQGPGPNLAADLQARLEAADR
jgi:hypothetical protein